MKLPFYFKSIATPKCLTSLGWHLGDKNSVNDTSRDVFVSSDTNRYRSLTRLPHKNSLILLRATFPLLLPFLVLLISCRKKGPWRRPNLIMIVVRTYIVPKTWGLNKIILLFFLFILFEVRSFILFIPNRSFVVLNQGEFTSKMGTLVSTSDKALW